MTSSKPAVEEAADQAHSRGNAPSRSRWEAARNRSADVAELSARLRRWRREFVLRACVDGLAGGVAWIAGWCLGSAVLDAVFFLPWGARCALFCGGVLLALGRLALLLRGIWGVGPERLLRDASSLRRELACYLLPAWELARGVDGGAHTSPALARAHVLETERRLRECPEFRVYPPSPSRRARRAWLALAALACLTAPWLIRRSQGLGRFLPPWHAGALEELLDVSPGSARVPWGASVTLAARLKPKGRSASRPHGTPELWLREARGRDSAKRDPSWSRAVWDREDGDRRSYTVPELTGPIQYRFRWGERRTRAYLVEPAPFPRLDGLTARVYLPLGGTNELSLDAAGELGGLRGGWVVLRGRPNTPLSAAEAAVSYLNRPIPLLRKPSGEYEAGFPLTQDGTFQLNLKSEEGFSDPHPVVYTLRALLDRPPEAELLSPAFDVEASPKEPLPLTYRVRDDHGIASVELAYRVVKEGRKEVTLPLIRFRKPAAEYVGDARWDLSGLPLGESVEFRIRAADNNPLRPGEGWSTKATVRLVDFEEAHMRTSRDWVRALDGLRALAEREERARLLLGALARAESRRVPEESERLLVEWTASQSGLGKEWERVLAELKGAADSMAQDPYSNPGSAEQTRAAWERLSERTREEMREAGARDWPALERSHARLEEEARRAARLLGEGRELQSLQDFWSQARGMDQTGAELASALDEMAKRPDGASAQDQAKLAQALGLLREQMEALSTAISALPKPADSAAPSTKRRQTYVVPLGSARQSADALRRALEAGDLAQAARLARQMSEELGRVRQAIADAAASSARGRGAAGGESGGDGRTQRDELSRRMEEAAAAWRELIEEQNGSLELAQKLHEEGVRARVREQKRLLERLEARQRTALEGAAALTPPVGEDVLGWMRGALREFQRREIAQAPSWLEQAGRRLRALASSHPAAAVLGELAGEQESIREALVRGIPEAAPEESQLSGAAAAAAVQARVRRKTGALREQVESLAAEAVTLTPQAGRSLEAAQQEQAAAEAALGDLKLSEALRREERAVDLLERGWDDLSSAAKRQMSVEQGGMRPFSGGRGTLRPAGPRGRSGMDTGFVPLPSAKDYQPPREIRKDLERSLRERRPRAYDPAIKEYFRRIAE